jgi:ATP synthase protein I
LLQLNFESPMGASSSHWNPPEAFDPQSEPPYPVLTASQAKALQARHPAISPWRVVLSQAVVGVFCAGLAALLWQSGDVAWSALYGAGVVVIPGALMAHGMSKRVANPAAAFAGFLFWEMVKILLALALLLLALKVVPHPQWLALVVNMVVCTKISWWALLRQRPLLAKHTRESDTT